MIPGMKRAFLLILPALLFKLNAQEGQPSQRTCETGILPQQFEAWLQELKPADRKFGNQNYTQSVFNIPVIVHIIHNNEAVNNATATTGGNLNAAQVIDQINILNKDFNGNNSDTSLIPAAFKALLGKFQINFCLAVVNPTGGVLAEPGINRVNRTSQGWNAPPYSSNYITNTIKPNTIWDPYRYLNVWVCSMSSGLLGFATFPNPGTSGLQGITGSYGTATTDGVASLNTAFGSIGTGGSGQFNKGRTVTHEVGHWLGLRHIWGDGNCANDFCNDTPPAQTANYNCPSFPYKSGVCSGNTTGEMTMNFMDYTNDACMYMFTKDQKYRAQLILTNSPMRAALLTSTVCNLPALTDDIGITYVVSPTYNQALPCIDYIDPVVNLTNYGSNSITNAQLTYNVDGVNTQTLNWNGNLIPGASVNVQLAQINGISFGPHVFSVNISAPNGGPDNNLSNNNNQQYFQVVNSVTITVNSATICSGNPANLLANGAASYTWNTGATSASLSITPPITTVYTVTGANGQCSASKTTTVQVQLKPVVSVNDLTICAGESGELTASGALNYIWNTFEAGPYISNSPQQTTSYTVTGSDSYGCSSTAVGTMFVDLCTGFFERVLQSDIRIYPNPARHEITIDIGRGLINFVDVTDISGRKLLSEDIGQGPKNINISNLAIGVYYLVITSDNTTTVKKLVKN
jgi:hypothetical protein